MSVLPGFLWMLPSCAQTPQAPPTPAEIEAEVLENVRNQPLGDGTVADLALPEEFLRRVADRIVRSSYEERYRLVVEDHATPAPETAAARPRSVWIALIATGAALLAIGWASVARRRGARSA